MAIPGHLHGLEKHN